MTIIVEARKGIINETTTTIKAGHLNINDDESQEEATLIITGLGAFATRNRGHISRQNKLVSSQPIENIFVL